MPYYRYAKFPTWEEYSEFSTKEKFDNFVAKFHKVKCRVCKEEDCYSGDFSTMIRLGWTEDLICPNCQIK